MSVQLHQIAPVICNMDLVWGPLFFLSGVCVMFLVLTLLKSKKELYQLLHDVYSSVWTVKRYEVRPLFRIKVEDGWSRFWDRERLWLARELWTPECVVFLTAFVGGGVVGYLLPYIYGALGILRTMVGV